MRNRPTYTHYDLNEILIDYGINDLNFIIKCKFKWQRFYHDIK